MSGSTGPRGIPPTPVRQDARQVRRWRRLRLMAAGYDELAAHRLARRDDTDVHALLVRQENALREARNDEERRRRHG
ncbi:MAG TPA: hypothetical protein VGE14_14350 [Marmoricola sp.]